MSQVHTQELTRLFERNADEWRKSSRQENVVTSATIAGREVAAKTSCADGRTSWTLDGKRAAFSAIHSALNQADETCDGSRGALCSSQDPNNCNRKRDCPAFA